MDPREEIVRASIELGTELGEEGLTMRAIAVRMRMSVASVYQCFDSKAAILREIRSLGVRMLNRALATADHNDRFTERLRGMCFAYVGFARANPWLYRVVFHGEELDYSTMSEQERSDRLLPLQSAGAMFRAGIERGEFRSDLDPERAVQGTWAAVHGIALVASGGPLVSRYPAFPPVDLERFIAQFVATLVRAYGVASSR
jgi:AcrR family transcriptional regulator